MRIPIVLLILLAACAPGPVRAQETRTSAQTTVRIEDGSVFVNGRRLPPGEVPQALREGAQRVQFTFDGDARFYLNGRFFGVAGGRLVELPEAQDDDVVVYFRGQAEAALDEPVLAPPSAGAETSPTRTIWNFARVLDDRADRIERLGREVTMKQFADIGPVADRMRQEAEESALVLRAFPRIEMQSYLQGLQGRDAMLYGRLMEELRMESETSMLAAQIQAEADVGQRSRLETSLRSRLDEIFELKQQNRRDEISALEKQLADLRSQLSAREANRKGIIDRRLHELVGPVRR